MRQKYLNLLLTIGILFSCIIYSQEDKESIQSVQGIQMSKEIDVLFIAGFGPIVQDNTESQKLYIETLNLSLKKTENNYCYTEELAGANSFALWPLSQAAESCFGQKNWPKDTPVPQSWLEFDVKDIVKATEVMQAKGYNLLISNRKEPWGQTVTRFLSPEGILVGLTYTPWLRDKDKQ